MAATKYGGNNQGQVINLTPCIFGENRLDAKKHITYAASMSNITDISPADEETIKKWMTHFSFISVRESDLQKN